MHLTLNTQITSVIALLYILQLAPFLYLNTENKIKTLIKKKNKLRIYQRKQYASRVVTKHLSNIFSPTTRNLLGSTKELKQT